MLRSTSKFNFARPVLCFGTPLSKKNRTFSEPPTPRKPSKILIESNNMRITVQASMLMCCHQQYKYNIANVNTAAIPMCRCRITTVMLPRYHPKRHNSVTEMCNLRIGLKVESYIDDPQHRPAHRPDMTCAICA